MNNILLLLKNIQNYGLIIFTKMILYEILFSIRFLNFKSLKYEEINNDNYFKTKNKKNIIHLIYQPRIIFYQN